MKTFHQIIFIVAVLFTSTTISVAQGDAVISAPTLKAKRSEKIVIITGARFAYPLVQKWIDEYNQVNPDVQIIIESRGTNDPTQYDLLIEAYEPDEAVKKTREYVYIARYAVLPVANSRSAFAKTYADKGLNEKLVKQLFFHDVFADKENEVEIKAPYSVYTRLQKAGVPIIFTSYYGYSQKDVKGKAIAGSDEHLLKAVLRDSIAVTYLPLSLLYDQTTRKPIQDVTILPVDLNGNDKVNDEEKIYSSLETVIDRFENKKEGKNKEIKNVPIGDLHFSVNKTDPNTRALEFLRWVLQNGLDDLHTFGYLSADPEKINKERFERFVSQHIKQ